MTPSIAEFDPRVIPYQYRVIKDIKKNFDYSKGVHEILLSGSLGSAKTTLLAHVISLHAIQNIRTSCMLGRETLPSLKDTLYKAIKEHLEGETPFDNNDTRGIIKLSNESDIFCHSWADKKYKKIRSYEYQVCAIEELTENDEMEFYKEIKNRIGRVKNDREKFIICATNPDDPAHWAYEYFIQGQEKYDTRHVYYSVTSDNPFLDENYIRQIKETLTAEEIQRMIYGKWVSISRDKIYYAFSEEYNVIPEYRPNPQYPICITYDFNIGLGKPMSVGIFQYINRVFYFFDEVIIYSANTEDTLEEMWAKQIINQRHNYIIHGDATGRSRTTKSNQTDYDVIEEFLLRNNIDFEVDVPIANPSVRSRHVIVNGKLKNSEGKVSVKVVAKKCPTLVKGLRLTALKKGASYIEDDSKPWQHITTAMGYGILSQLDRNDDIPRFFKRKL